MHKLKRGGAKQKEAIDEEATLESLSEEEEGEESNEEETEESRKEVAEVAMMKPWESGSQRAHHICLALEKGRKVAVRIKELEDGIKELKNRYRASTLLHRSSLTFGSLTMVQRTS